MLVEEIKSIKSNKKDLRNFAVTIGIAFVIIGLLVLLVKGNLYLTWFGIGIFILLIGFIVPVLLLPFQKLWMILSILLGWLSTRIILSLLFYFVLTPIRFIAKLFGKNFLDLKIEKNAETYWHYRERKVLNPLDYEQQF
jgi:hypothetical protein